jgi:hypothetical protein
MIRCGAVFEDDWIELHGIYLSCIVVM